MRYKEMIEEAKKKGLTSEKVMWESVDDLDEMLCAIKKEHPDMFWNFIRKQHGIMYNNHYDEKFAMWDVEHMKPLGMYWTVKVRPCVRKLSSAWRNGLARTAVETVSARRCWPLRWGA